MATTKKQQLSRLAKVLANDGVTGDAAQKYLRREDARDIQAALSHLQSARDLMIDHPQTIVSIRKALKSAEGALRHAPRRVHRLT